jgi:hypothetical protein
MHCGTGTREAVSTPESICVVPPKNIKAPATSLTELSTQFIAPYASSECKILDVISKPLTFAGNLAFWGVLWGPVRILHPFWQGKGAFLKLPR